MLKKRNPILQHKFPTCNKITKLEATKQVDSVVTRSLYVVAAKQVDLVALDKSFHLMAIRLIVTFGGHQIDRFIWWPPKRSLYLVAIRSTYLATNKSFYMVATTLTYLLAIMETYMLATKCRIFDNQNMKKRI